MTEMLFDYLIVGAGAAGCVIANRLSSDPNVNVLLLEAGADLVPGEEPASIRDPFPASYGDPQYAWPSLHAEVGVRPPEGGPRFSRHYVQGRVMGGSSSIMGMMAQRGIPSDFEEWRAMGAAGWGWDGVLPFFNRLENDLDFAGPMHGASGPIPIRRTPRAAWGPFCQAVADALSDRSFPWLEDLNAQFGDGVSTVPMNNLPQRRVSAASAYLDMRTRQRRNLQILTDTVVERLLLKDNTVSGVAVRHKAERRAFSARNTIVCAGALNTPGLLLRSGIGDAAQLEAAGVSPVHHLRGVGSNLANHPTVHLAVHLPARAVQSARERTWAQAVLRYSSGHAGCATGDMLLFPTNKTSWHPLGRRIAALGTCVYKSYSRGDVRIAGADPDKDLRVRFNLLDDERDYERMVSGLRFALEVLADPRVAEMRNEVFLPSGGQANSLNRPGLGNFLRSAAINALFATTPAVRRRALKRSIIDPQRTARDEQRLRDIVNAAAAPVHHVCGTAKMGFANDPYAVADPRCRVYGLRGLRVADASIMPSIVSANTHLTVLMIAEKAAEMIAQDDA